MALATTALTADGGGWRLASNAELAALFNDFSLCDFTFTAVEGTNQNCTTPIAAASDGSPVDPDTEPDVQFVTLFGNTYTEYPGNEGTDDVLFGSFAFHGSDEDGDGLYNTSSVFDDLPLHGLRRAH